MKNIFYDLDKDEHKLLISTKKGLIGMKISIYGSSFDPITNVHLWTASTVAHRAKLDKVIFPPSANNRIDKQLQTDDEHRWNMIQLAIEDNPIFVADDYEISLRGRVSGNMPYTGRVPHFSQNRACGTIAHGSSHHLSQHN